MDTYLMMLYVTLEQEECLKQLFLGRGWAYKKPDLLNTTDQIGGLSTPQSPFTVLSQTDSITDKSNTAIPAPPSTGKRKAPLADTPTPRKSKRERKPKISSIYVTQFTPSVKGGHEYSHTDSTSTAEAANSIVIKPSPALDNLTGEMVSHDSTAVSRSSSGTAAASRGSNDASIAPIASGAALDQSVATTSGLSTGGHDGPGTSVDTFHSFVDSTGVVNVKVETMDDDYEPEDEDTESEDEEEGVGEDSGATESVVEQTGTEQVLDPDITAAIESAVKAVNESSKQKKMIRVVSPVPQSRAGRSYRPYSPTAVSNAYHAVNVDGLSIRGAARKYGIPETTIRDRIRGRVGAEVIKSGKEPLFNQEEEQFLAEHLKAMASYGYGYTRSEVVDIASAYSIALQKRDEAHPLTLMWYHGFMRRWPDLKGKKPQTLELQRIKAISEENVTTYFNELEKIMIKYDLTDSPQRIYIIDEKVLKQNHSPSGIAGAATTKRPDVTSGSTVTVIGCGNASGQQIPPFFIFPGHQMNDELLQGCTPGTDGTVSDWGLSNIQIFMQYLTSHFLKYVQGRDENKPVLILYDGHISHALLPLIDKANLHNIQLFVLPAHMSHALHPVDGGCFGPFERIYTDECHTFMSEKFCPGIDRYSICKVACETYAKAVSPANLQSSFRNAGIYPLDASAVKKFAFIQHMP